MKPIIDGSVSPHFKPVPFAGYVYLDVALLGFAGYPPYLGWYNAQQKTRDVQC
jgi:hypothetical protein